MLAVMVLELYDCDKVILARDLERVVAESPCVFDNTLVVAALDCLHNPDCAPDFVWLCSLCSSMGMHLVAVRGGNAQQRHSALQAGLSCLCSQSPAYSVCEPEHRPTPRTEQQKAFAFHMESCRQEMVPVSRSDHVPPRVISTPVRSGQQVFHTGDLILAQAVSQGAEVLASGNIYAYGPLRGRALAGACGNASARIFCTCFEAEMVSIDGHYKMISPHERHLWKKSVQVQLNGRELSVQPL